jgi:ABC-type branched-subunit amino acid transport system substrate-binding protein
VGVRDRTVAAGLIAAALLAAAPSSRVGVEMPLAGDDGARGLASVTAIRLALGNRVVVRDSARGGAQNPHQDEGSDNDVDVRTAPSIVARFAGDARVVAAVGGLRRNVGDADAAAAERDALPMVVLARWSRSAHAENAFCLCAAPPRLVAFARRIARRRFREPLRVVLLGSAASLARAWPASFAAKPDGGGAVLVIADDRAPTVWRASAFASAFTAGYRRDLDHRGARIIPAGVRRGDVLLIAPRFAANTERAAFARRYHDAAGFVPDDDTLRAYAAAQIVRTAGRSRAQVREALARRRFRTAAGPVAFDRDGYWANAVLDAEPG